MRHFPSILAAAVISILVFALAGCGAGSSGGPPAVVVSVSAPASQVALGLTAQFTVSVQNATNSAVTWEVNTVSGGNSTVGTITSNGLYTAPNAIPTPNTIQVTAVSVQDTSKSGSVTITLDSNIVVSVSPTSASVTANLTQQFTVSVQNAVNVGVTWEVNGTPGGSTANGTITNTGLYTAPATVPSSAVTVSAVSVADPSKSGSAQVTVTTGVTVSISPNPSIVFVGNTLQLTASVQNTTNTSVTWTISSAGGDSISASGLYTPNPSLTQVSLVIVTATSVADPTKFATASVLANIHSADDSALTGRYAFSGANECPDCANGFDTFSAGSFVADGAGNVTSATLDFLELDNPEGSTNLAQSMTDQQAIGAYSVGSNNLGTVIFVGANGQRAGVGEFIFALGSFNSGVAGRGQISGGNIADGVLLAQDSTAFSASAINGNYALGSSLHFLSESEPLAGEFHADGAGNLSRGFLDVNQPKAVPPVELSDASFTGTYTVDPATGRGTATMNVATVGMVNSTFYVISAKELFLFGYTFSGSALQQQAASFSNASLNGTTVFALGSNAGLLTGQLGGTTGNAGLLTADGNGNVTGVVDGVIDNTGVVVQNKSFTGTYTVSSNGRGTLNVFNQTFVIYLVGQNSAFVLEQPNNLSVQAGLIEPQAAGPFSDVSISGTFSSGGSSSPLDETVGTYQGDLGPVYLTSNGTGSIGGYAFDSSGTYTATYSVASNGRGTLTDSTNPSNPVQYVLYMISTNKFVAVEISGSQSSVFGPGAVSFFGP